MYLGVFCKCRDFRKVLFTGFFGEGIDSMPGGKHEISLENCIMAKRKEAHKTEQEKP